MTDYEEQFAMWCYKISGLYHRREKLILEGLTEKADHLNEPIKILIEDFKQWLSKQG